MEEYIIKYIQESGVTQRMVQLAEEIVSLRGTTVGLNVM